MRRGEDWTALDEFPILKGRGLIGILFINIHNRDEGVQRDKSRCSISTF